MITVRCFIDYRSVGWIKLQNFYDEKNNKIKLPNYR